MDTYFCPSCSYPLVYQIRAGVLSWFCPHCYQEMPYAASDGAIATVRRSRIGQIGGKITSVAVIEQPRSMGLETSLELERIVDIFYRHSHRSFDKIERSADDRAYITVSCGVATAVPQTTVEPETLVRSADRALFAAKTRGRDRVEVNREAIGPSN